jgi:hypothetical protein
VSSAGVVVDPVVPPASALVGIGHAIDPARRDDGWNVQSEVSSDHVFRCFAVHSLGLDRQRSGLGITRFEQYFIFGNLEMIMQKGDAETSEPVVTVENRFNLLKARLIFFVDWNDVINVRKRSTHL